MHGWYSNSRCWNCWEQEFISNGWLWKSAERGYGYIESSEPLWELNDNENKGQQQEQKKLFICHSLGMHLVPKIILSKATHIVLINSFSRFIPSGKENRSIKIALEGMKKQIGRSSESQMLLKFTKKANNSAFSEGLHLKDFHPGLSIEGREKLKEDLELLINTSKLPSSINKQAKVLLLEGENDAIVCSSTKSQLMEDLKNHLEQDPLTWILKGEGHFIRLSKILSDVMNWLELN